MLILTQPLTQVVVAVLVTVSNLKKEILSTAVKLDKGGLNFEFDNRQLFNSCRTVVLNEIADNLWSKIKQFEPEVIFGKGVGSYPLLIAIKMRAFLLDGVDLSVLFIRDTRKKKGGFRKLIEGASYQELNGKKAAFIDDIYNTGSTFEQCKEDLFNEGFSLNICTIAVLIDFCYNHEPLLQTVMTRKDLGLTRQDANLPKLLQTQKWIIKDHFKFNNDYPVKSTPVVNDSKAYVASDDTNHYCYDVNSGDLVWSYESTEPTYKGSVGMTLLDGQRAYWSAYDGFVTCADKFTGGCIWSRKIDDYIHSSLCVNEDDQRLYLGTEHSTESSGYGLGDVVCLDGLNGLEIWRTQSKSMCPCTPIYLKHKKVVMTASNDFHIYVLNADNGDIVKKIETKGEVKGRLTLSACEKFVIASTNTGNIYCVDLQDYSVLWQRNIGDKSHHGYPIVEQQKVYVSNSAGYVICLELANGMIEWVCRLRGSIGWSVISTESCLVVGTTLGYVVTIDKNTGEKLSSDRLSDAFIYQPCTYSKLDNCLIVSTNKDLICYDIKL